VDQTHIHLDPNPFEMGLLGLGLGLSFCPLKRGLVRSGLGLAHGPLVKLTHLLMESWLTP